MKAIKIAFTMAVVLFSLYTTAQTNRPPTPVMEDHLYQQYLIRFMEFPDSLMEQGIEGTVVLQFINNSSGQTDSVWVAGSLHPVLDTLALRLFSRILWQPALNYGVPSSARSSFDVKFNRKQYQRKARARGYGQPPGDFNPHTCDNKIYNQKQLTVRPVFLADGSPARMGDFINERLKYPDNAQKLGISGDVEISFVIETNGMASNIEVHKYLGGGCTEEAIRLVEDMRWQPGQVNGEYVRSLLELKITFRKDGNKANYIPNQSNSGI